MPPKTRWPNRVEPLDQLLLFQHTVPPSAFCGQNQTMSSRDISPSPLPDLFAEVAPDFVMPEPFDAPSIRWGILGAGGIARTFATDVPRYSNQEIVAIGSRTLGKAQAFAQENDIPLSGAHGSYEDLVADPNVDAVYVATPHVRHHRDALLALNSGKPVLVEKAFAMSTEQAKEVFDTAREKGLFAMEAMWSRHLPHYRFIREAIASGKLGKLVEVTADHGQRLTHIPRLVEPAMGGGAMLDLGVYPVSLIEMALGKPTTQQALGRLSERGIDVGDVVIGKHCGALSVATCQLDGISPTQATLTFEGGSVVMPTQFYRPTQVSLRVYALDPKTGAASDLRKAKWDARIVGGFQYQAAEAARCIRAGLLESPVVPWNATLAVQEMMDAALAQVGVTYEEQ